MMLPSTRRTHTELAQREDSVRRTVFGFWVATPAVGGITRWLSAFGGCRSSGTDRTDRGPRGTFFCVLHIDVEFGEPWRFDLTIPKFGRGTKRVNLSL
jgi:hypothetical protein